MDTKEVEIDANSVHTAINFGGEIPHFLFAGVFFVVLAIVSLNYFPKTDATTTQKADGNKTTKAKRNMVFKPCG